MSSMQASSSPRRGSYESVNPSPLAVDTSSEVVPSEVVPSDDEATEALKGFIPLLEFQIDKLFGTVAEPVFYIVAIALLLMNFGTVAVPFLWAPLVQEESDLNHAMAGTPHVVAFTLLTLLIVKWHRLLRERVQKLVRESFAEKIKRACCPAADTNGSMTAAPDSWLEETRTSLGTPERASLGRTKSTSVTESKLVRSTSTESMGAHITGSAADIYISSSYVHNLDLAAAAAIKEALEGHAIWSSADLHAGGDEAWLVESHIKEVLSTCNNFVALISQELLTTMESAHEEWNGTVAEWERALELHKQGALTITPAWLGRHHLTSATLDKISEEAPKCGEGTVKSEELFDSRIEERSVRAIVEGMLKLAEDSLRLSKVTASTGAGSANALMLSYRVTETGDAKDAKDHKKKGDNFTPRLQRALQAQGYSCFVGEKQLEGGDEWATTIAHAVKNCKAMLIISSPTYGQTKWTFRELQMADNNQKKLIPIYHSGEFPPNEKVEVFLSGLQYIDFSEKSTVGFDEKVSELVVKLRKQKIFPDLPTRPTPGANLERIASMVSSEGTWEVKPLTDVLRERLEMDVMLNAAESSSSARSVQLLNSLDEEIENSRDRKMREALLKGKKAVRHSMKWLAWLSTLVMYVYGPCVGVVAGMAVQQRLYSESDFQWNREEWADTFLGPDFAEMFITLRLWLLVVFISQFAVSLLFLTIQLFAVESHLNYLLALRLSVMLENPLEHLARWDGVTAASAFDAQYTLLTTTYDNMSQDWQTMLVIALLTSHTGATLWLLHFFSYPNDESVCSQQAVMALSVQLFFFYMISMAPFICIFDAPYAQSAHSMLRSVVRHGTSERFDWVDDSSDLGRMQLIVYMQSNPVVWRVFGSEITLFGGRVGAALVFLVDLGFVVWRYVANDGFSDSGNWTKLHTDFASSDSGWGAWLYIVIAFAVFTGALRPDSGCACKP